MIEKHYQKVKSLLSPSTSLCVVSKKRTIDEILSYYNVGERIFGENKAQELLQKVDKLPRDIQWNFIGHLQTNKVKQILPYVSRIQSVDSIKLALEIEKQAEKINKIMPILLEFHFAKEDSNKTGHSLEGWQPFVETCLALPHLKVEGIMLMGPHTTDKEEIKKIFLEGNAFFHSLQEKYSKKYFSILSMGMSADYDVAIQCGSTMIRIGTYLFKEKED